MSLIFKYISEMSTTYTQHKHQHLYLLIKSIVECLSCHVKTSHGITCATPRRLMASLVPHQNVSWRHLSHTKTSHGITWATPRRLMASLVPHQDVSCRHLIVCHNSDNLSKITNKMYFDVIFMASCVTNPEGREDWFRQRQTTSIFSISLTNHKHSALTYNGLFTYNYNQKSS